jgi:hypothetical protein
LLVITGCYDSKVRVWEVSVAEIGRKEVPIICVSICDRPAQVVRRMDEVFEDEELEDDALIMIAKGGKGQQK